VPHSATLHPRGLSEAAVAHTLVCTAPEQLATITRQFLEEIHVPAPPGERAGEPSAAAHASGAS
jgi:hypothetical protein